MKKLKKEFPYDPEKHMAVIRQSICTGEKAAGFRDRETGHFSEVMLIHTPAEEAQFKKLYGIDVIRTEY